MTERNEEDLWEAFRNGSEPAFAAIYNTYFPVLYQYGYHIARNEDLVKDCIQNVFVELWKSRRNLSPTTSINYYLLRVMRRKVYQATKQEQPTLMTASMSDNYDWEVNFSPEFDLIANEQAMLQKEQLVQAINQLSNRQKEAITLLYIEGLSYPQISDIMSLKVRTVYNLVHTALEKLKVYLGQPGVWMLATALGLGV